MTKVIGYMSEEDAQIEVEDATEAIKEKLMTIGIPNTNGYVVYVAGATVDGSTGEIKIEMDDTSVIILQVKSVKSS